MTAEPRGVSRVVAGFSNFDRDVVISFTSNVKKYECESSKPEKKDSVVGIFPIDQIHTTLERELALSVVGIFPIKWP